MRRSRSCLMPVSGTDRRQRALFRYDGRTAKEIPWLTYTSESYIWRVEEYILSRQKPPLPLSAICENPMGILEGDRVVILSVTPLQALRYRAKVIFQRYRLKSRVTGSPGFLRCDFFDRGDQAESDEDE